MKYPKEKKTSKYHSDIFHKNEMIDSIKYKAFCFLIFDTSIDLVTNTAENKPCLKILYEII